MRGPLGAALAVAMLAAVAAHAAPRVVARPALTPAQAAELERAGTPWRGALMPPAVAKLYEERVRRSRAMPHVLAPEGMDLSRAANRRSGWRPPAARSPHARVTGSERDARRAALLATDPDTVRIAFLRIDFAADRSGGQTTGDGRFDLSGPDTLLPPLDRAPHNRDFYLAHLEALKRYYEAQSYGRLVVEGDVWPREQDRAYTCTDLADFGPWAFSQTIYRDAVHMFRTMMFAADSQSVELGDRIPWDSYDRFVLIHAGSDFQSDIRQDSPLDIPSFTIGVQDTDVVIFPDSTLRPVVQAAIIPETVNQDGFYGTINGVLAHENGHNLFGFADLYDVNSGYPVVGLWSLMDSGNLAGTQVQLANGDIIYAIGLLPPSVDPFQRWFTTDALEFVDVAWGATMPIQESARHPDMRRVWLTSDEYLLIENRWIAPGATIDLDQDSTTRVILGPRLPDRFEYDALLPGPGMLVWHVDASVVPFTTALRPNPDFSFNTNFRRRGIRLIEGDALEDLGDPGSPFLLGSYRDPWYVGNRTVLSDTTRPDLRPNVGTRTHVRLEVLDAPDTVMRLSAVRTWSLPAWPVTVDAPDEGAQLLAVDADGDGALEVCWAGGGGASPDSVALFAVTTGGTGIGGGPHVFASLDRRPRQPLAAVATGATEAGAMRPGPAVFAATTYADGPDLTTAGGRVWLIDHTGTPLPGWPANLPAVATTPAVISGAWPDIRVFVGLANGRAVALDKDGVVLWTSGNQVAGGVSGRLAVQSVSRSAWWLGFAGADGALAVERWDGGVCADPPCAWQRQVAEPGFAPELLLVEFNAGAPEATCGWSLVAHQDDRLFALCLENREPLPGWGGAYRDTIVPGLALADADGDGFPEVVGRTRRGGVAYWNVTGAPPPGWPEPTSRDPLPATSPPIVVDVDGDRAQEIVSVDGGGIVTALRRDARQPEGWPLATGSGPLGSPLAADLDGDGRIELVVPDRVLPDSLEFLLNGRFGSLYAFALPGLAGSGPGTALAWPMLGGDPGRTGWILPARRTLAPAAAAGPLVPGTLMAYPNPARRRPVAFAYRLTEPARVDFTILDTSGHAVATFARDGRMSDNLETWDPGQAPAGLYLVRIRMRGQSGSEHVETLPVGVIK